MKEITIPSVNSEKCNVTLRFNDKKEEKLPWEDKPQIFWLIEVSCYSPVFHAEMKTMVSENMIHKFVNDLKIVEQERKGQCSIYYQHEHGLRGRWDITIRSVDSVGHFVVDVSIDEFNPSDIRNQINKLRISYEIEPSLLMNILKNCNFL